MIRWRVADVIISLSRHRDEMRLANFERVRGLDAERKLLRRPAKHCLPNLAPLWANGNFRANRSGVVSGGIYERDMNVPAQIENAENIGREYSSAFQRSFTAGCEH